MKCLRITVKMAHNWLIYSISFSIIDTKDSCNCIAAVAQKRSHCLSSISPGSDPKIFLR